MFSATVNDYWFSAVARSDVPAESGTFRVAVDAALPPNRRVMLLDLDGAGGIATFTPAVALELGLDPGQEIVTQALHQALDGSAVVLNGPDALLYFAAEEQTRLVAEAPPASVRQLTQADAALFDGLVDRAPDEDLDEAFVELDHWLVFGAVIDDRLVCAASMFPWAGTELADLGVITLPEYRGQGHGRAVVRAIAAHAVGLGYEPQYRCQLDNEPSIALARSAGLEILGTWDVVQDEN